MIISSQLIISVKLNVSISYWEKDLNCQYANNAFIEWFVLLF